MNDKTYERLGEPQERRADVRIVAATNKPIEELVRSGKFRDDLLFRLNVLSLTVPPLRERSEDIAALAGHFLEFFATRQGRAALHFSEQAMSMMVSHSWPGNLRELRNAIERAVILGSASILQPADLGFSRAASDAKDIQIGALVDLDCLEREHIARVIARSPTLEAAARTLGIDSTTLSRKRKRYGLT
jgi:NtrC-family two-component system response regulator AlgB